MVGDVEKNSFIVLPGKGGQQQAHVLKTVYPHLERIVRSFIVLVPRACDQLLDILLIVWW